MQHFYNLAEFSPDFVDSLIEEALRHKAEPTSNELEGRQFALLFLAPSLRTRCSFEVGIRQMGGGVSTLEAAMFYGLEVREGVRMDGEAAEHIKEAAPILSRFFSGLGLRVMAGGRSAEADLQDRLFQEFCRHAAVPVFNMESAVFHPCQALADMLTIRELLGNYRNRRLTVTWAPHPRALPTAVPNSLVLASVQLGMDVTLACPEGFDLPDFVIGRVEELSNQTAGRFRLTHDQKDGIRDAEIVYAKSWGGLIRYESAEAEQKLRASHADWIVDADLMDLTADAYFMHCLPVRRNIVVTDAVIDGPRSAVVQQAENRLHAQKAVLKALYGSTPQV